MKHLLESLRLGVSAFIGIVGGAAALLLIAAFGETVKGNLADFPIGDVISLMVVISLVSIACFSLSAWLWGM